MDDLFTAIGKAFGFLARGIARVIVEEIFERFFVGVARITVPALTFGAAAVDDGAPRPPRARLWWRSRDDTLILRRGLAVVLGAALVFVGLFAAAALVRMKG